MVGAVVAVWRRHCGSGCGHDSLECRKFQTQCNPQVKTNLRITKGPNFCNENLKAKGMTSKPQVFVINFVWNDFL